ADTYYLMSFTDTRNEILRELTAEEKEKITASIDETKLVAPMKSKKLHSEKKAIQTFKSLQSQYQSFYEKRK
ncbi:MAG: flagellar biosynthesis protein FliZ, partial [Carnobacterium sp.]